MSLKVIGSGFGRTGTFSLKRALGMIGFGPCYHMSELDVHHDHLKYWYHALDGKYDWDYVFNGYNSTVDWPSTHYWEELFKANPDAKVIHTIRDPESWYKSIINTIFKSITRVDQPDEDSVSFHKMACRMILENTFEGRLEDKEFALKYFHDYTERVKSIVPQKQLLIYDVSQGWQPLCEFLDVDIPAEDFPVTNSTKSFQERHLI